MVSGRLIAYIHIHLSQVGRLTMSHKVAALFEFFGVHTDWEGPGDVSPVGHAANVHLDLACPNFGIQEARQFTQAEQDVFPGCPVLKDGITMPATSPVWELIWMKNWRRNFPLPTSPASTCAGENCVAAMARLPNLRGESTGAGIFVVAKVLLLLDRVSSGEVAV